MEQGLNEHALSSAFTPVVVHCQWRSIYENQLWPCGIMTASGLLSTCFVSVLFSRFHTSTLSVSFHVFASRSWTLTRSHAVGLAFWS